MSATHVVSVFPNFALVIAGDANVWLPHFRLNRQRSRDNVIFPYIQQLLDLGLTIINPQSRATHVAGCCLRCGVCFHSFGRVIISLSTRVIHVVRAALLVAQA